MAKIKLSKLDINPDNPRIFKREKLDKLKESIEDFEKMLALRPMVVDENWMVLGGNMRLTALKELGYKEIPRDWVKQAKDLTEEEKQKFIIKDNVDFGLWDFGKLESGWDMEELEDWGLEVPLEKKIDEAKDGEEIEVPASVQLQPPMEYIMIIAEPNSVEWEELKEWLKLRMVRRGGYKKGSVFDAVSLERVLHFKDFKDRVHADSDTK